MPEVDAVSVRVICPLGHVWSIAHEAGTTLPLSQSQCPVCGQASDNISLAAEAGRTRAMTGEQVVTASASVPGYEILGVLGRGGMGVVYRARQLSLNRVVALKVPLADGVASPEQLARFRAEAELIARLRDPHILPVFDYGECEGRPYFSMEFADGGTLADRVADTVVPPRPAARLVATLARAVDAAHRAGVVHRDLKPANVLLSVDGTPKVSDFGLALSFAPGGSASSTGIEGTPAFMAPEQATGNGCPVGPAADVYALGAILYRLLTGRPPFQAAGMSAMLELVREATPDPLRRSQPSVPRDLEAICLRCLRKSPNDRYASAAALADDLDRFLDGRDVVARRPPVWQRAARWAGRRPLAAAAIALLAVASIVGVAYWSAFHRESVGYFTNYESRYGTLVGVGPLTTKEVQHRDTSLRFRSRGGRVVAIDVVNADDRPFTRHTFFNEIAPAGSFGNPDRNDCQYRFTYHADGRPHERIGLDARGDVVWSFVFTSDRAGEAGYFRNRHGLPVARVSSGATYVAYRYGPDGRLTAERYRDALNETRADGLGTFGRDYVRDDATNSFQILYIGRDEKPAACQYGFAGMRIVTDERFFLRHSELIDVEGARSSAVNGACITDFQCDNWGNLVRVTHRDKNGNRIMLPTEANGYTVERDDLGRVKWYRFWDLNDDPHSSGDGSAARHLAYDANGYPKQQSGYDTAGNPCLVREGFHRMDTEYDDCGNPTVVAYFGVKGEEVNVKAGYHRLVGKYEHGDLIELRKTDANGKPTPHGPGVDHETREYDDNRFRTRLTFRGGDGRVVLRTSDGIAGFTSINDRIGREVERRYFDVAGNRVANMDGFGGYVSSFDDLGRESVRRYRDTAGNPVVSVHGIAGFSIRYDKLGQEAEHRYIGLDGKPCRHIDKSYGERYSYDAARQKTSTVAIDAEGHDLTSAVVVTVVTAGGHGAAAGFAVDDVIVACGGIPVSTTAEAVNARKACGGNSQPIDIVVRRGNRTLTLTLPAGDPGFQFAQLMVPK